MITSECLYRPVEFKYEGAKITVSRHKTYYQFGTVFRGTVDIEFDERRLEIDSLNVNRELVEAIRVCHSHTAAEVRRHESLLKRKRRKRRRLRSYGS